VKSDPDYVRIQQQDDRARRRRGVRRNEANFSEKQIVELTVFCGMWNYSNRLCEALHVDLEHPDKRIEFQK
jgi:alkylhydroperoxidase family enzyme